MRITAALVAVLLSTTSFAFASPKGKKTTTTSSKSETVVTQDPPAADDTGVNKRDRKDGEPTADNSKNNKTDLDLTAQIRRAVVADKGLSVTAHNVKIIAQDGIVTLKGPVNSAAERASVEQKAVEVAGRTKVKNELEIKQ